MGNGVSVQAVVLDTSVLLKWFHQPGESHVGEALALKSAYEVGTLKIILPDLAIYELGNALRHKSRLRAIDVSRLIDALWRLEPTIIPIDRLNSLKVIEIAYRYGLTVYDAAFLSLALEAEVPLITADRKLYDKASDHVILLESLAYGHTN